MATTKRQTREALGVKAGDQIVIRGKVAFSELATPVEGDRLTQKVERQKKLGMVYPTTVPHRSVTITDVSVEPEFQGTPLATYHGQEIYVNKDGKHAMTLESKSPFAPDFFHDQGDGKAVKITELPAELGVGQEVKVLITAFASKKYANLGSAFDAFVLPPGEINYYENTAASQIGAFGLKLDGEEAPVAKTEDVDPSDNPFGAAPADTAVEETAVETPAPAVDAVPEDAKPEEPSGGVVDNPFA